MWIVFLALQDTTPAHRRSEKHAACLDGTASQYTALRFPRSVVRRVAWRLHKRLALATLQQKLPSLVSSRSVPLHWLAAVYSHRCPKLPDPKSLPNLGKDQPSAVFSQQTLCCVVAIDSVPSKVFTCKARISVD